MIKGDSAKAIAKYAWKKQPIKQLVKSNPTQNIWYAVLSATNDVMILAVSIKQVNDEAAAKTLGIRVIIDGITLSASGSLANNQWNYVYLDFRSDTIAWSTSLLNFGMYSAVCGQNVAIDLRIESAPGTNQLLYGNAQIETLEET